MPSLVEVLEAAARRPRPQPAGLVEILQALFRRPPMPPAVMDPALKPHYPPYQTGVRG
jgi:hypothetical protein